ncbi:glycosyltransferase [Coraliomargarita algicola]|uniref:Glycosyltransferase n=1 Tax=Coraliomargarita algicola TaxID=3092156 RepID=A0ABZ0RRI5_9BACT|nr:glycosyltransferase [Coraliomargarita sp. J2-16]WPJ97716.1 glycosyltransferase [Coraliomargarita sp. J2-16]
MRIILVSNLYPHSKAPMRALYNQRHFQALRSLGYEVEVIAPLPWFPGKRGLPSRMEMMDGIEVRHPRYFYTPGFAIHQHWRFYHLAVRRLLEQRIANSQEPVHVVLGFVYPDAVAMAPVCEGLQVPYSVLVLGSDFRVRIQQSKFKPLVEHCLLAAPHVFCPGSELRRDMLDAGLPPERVHAFNNGVEQDIFAYQGMPASDGSGEILFVGNFVDVKAPARLLQAFAQAAPDLGADVRLSMIGAGPLRSDLVRLAEALGITGRIDWWGRQAPDRVAERMRQAMALCLCSRSEGMPNVVIEALACGCPVVATAVGEVPQLIRAGENGFVIEVNAHAETQIIADLARSLRQVRHTKFDRASIAARMSGFTWQAAAKVLADVIALDASALESSRFNNYESN